MRAGPAKRLFFALFACVVVVPLALKLLLSEAQLQAVAPTLWVLSEVCYVIGAVLMFRAATRLTGDEAFAWRVLGGAIMTFAVGSAVLVIGGGSPGEAGPSDLFFLAVLPMMLAGLALLLRVSRVRPTRTDLIDGVAAALATAALSAAVLATPVLDSTALQSAGLWTKLALPVGDALLIGLLVAGLSLLHWRVERTFGLVAVGLLLYWVGDVGFVYLTSIGRYDGPQVTDLGYSAAFLLLAAASQYPGADRGEERGGAARDTQAATVSPIVFAGLSLAIVFVGALGDLHPLAVVLGALSLAAMLLRLGLTLSENARMLSVSRHEATTDPLTGLGNRRALLRDLDEAIRSGSPTTLVLCDLDGFKSYNDVFGHPAGDALLERLARNLAARVADGSGAAYRIGGDEFCALVHGLADIHQLDHLAAALSESGEGFQIGASLGAVQLPPEAKNAQDALRLVDQRMYACKNSNRASARAQSSEVLVQVLCERVPGMSRHLDAVRERATQTAIEMGIELSQIEHLRHAAMLHDIGCMSIPDAILSKPGPLNEEEIAFVQGHPAAGSRILEAAPALKHLAPIVRAVQERFDGTGYPDGLRGDQIPLESRIIAVCDAYDTMVEGRPFRAAMSEEAALAELYAASGTQFDPNVVDGFGYALLARHIVNRAA